VAGGASKLFTHFTENYDFDNIITYTDRSWSNNSVYLKLGFQLKAINVPNYAWVIDQKRVNKRNVTQEKLVKNNMIEERESISDCMYRHGYYRIYDCGSMVFEWSREQD
jgi:spore coat protein CotF